MVDSKRLMNFRSWIWSNLIVEMKIKIFSTTSGISIMMAVLSASTGVAPQPPLNWDQRCWRYIFGKTHKGLTPTSRIGSSSSYPQA